VCEDVLRELPAEVAAEVRRQMALAERASRGGAKSQRGAVASFFGNQRK